MNELSKLLQENLNIEFISATLSNPKNKDGVQKVKVRPILKKDVLYFQLESFQNNQAFHENGEEKKACEILLKYMGKYAPDADGDTKSSLYNSCKQKGKSNNKK